MAIAPLGHWADAWYAYTVDSANQVYRRTSTDDGLNWSAATLVRACSRGAFVAAAANWVFIQEHQVHAYVSDPTTGALSGPYTQTSPTTNGGHGLAAARDADDAGADVRYRLLFTVKGDIWAVTFDPDAHSYGAAHRLAPGADQATPAAADNRYPALACVSRGQLVATWVERHDNGLSGEPASWRYPVARVAVDDDAEHYGGELPLAAPDETVSRMAALYDPTGQLVYLGNDRLVLAARVYDEDPVWHRRWGPIDASSYTLRQHVHQPASLELTVVDVGNDWPYLGAAGYAEGPLRPLAEVTLTRGYRTAEGEETVDLPPCYIVGVQRGEGGAAGGQLRLTCTDALGLLRLWRAPEPLAWKDRAIRWLLAELCARVGLRYVDASEAALGRTLPLFTLHPGQTALAGALDLLRLGGCVARINPDGALSPLPWPQAGEAEMSIGVNGEVRAGRYGLGLMDATGVRISSGGAYAEGETIADAWALGLRLTAALHDGRIGLNGDIAATVRDRNLALAGLGWRADEAVIPARLDVELWDAVELLCAATEREGEATKRVVTGIEERREAARGVWEVRVEMGRG